MTRAIRILVTFASLAACVRPAKGGPIGWPEGDIIVNHPPHPFGGGGSDTEFRDDFGVPVWQRVADDILLSESATCRRVTWLGFYGSSLEGPPPPSPPATETMRIRFYAARLSDGLPGVVLYDESFVNPLRTATGNVVFVGANPPEYLFQVDLTTPMSLGANTPYWLEIVQVGDVDSHFRWEFSQADANGQAFINYAVSEWQHTQSITSDTAFQLWSIPEPSAALILLGELCMVRRCVTRTLPRRRRVK